MVKLSDLKKAEPTITHLDQIDPEEEHHTLAGAERFMNLQNKVIAMMPPELFPKDAGEMMALNNLVYNNVEKQRADVPRDVITRWEHMAPKRREREVENPLHYT